MRLLKLLDNLMYLPDFENDDIIMNKTNLNNKGMVSVYNYRLYNGSKYKVIDTKRFTSISGDTKQINKWGDLNGIAGMIQIGVKSYDGTKHILFTVKKNGSSLTVKIRLLTYENDNIAGGNEFMKNFNDKALKPGRIYWYKYEHVSVSGKHHKESMLFNSHDSTNLNDNYVLIQAGMAVKPNIDCNDNVQDE